jgi:hypothetical protein
VREAADVGGRRLEAHQRGLVLDVLASGDAVAARPLPRSATGLEEQLISPTDD